MPKVDINNINDDSDMESVASAVMKPARSKFQKKRVGVSVNKKAGVVYLGRIPGGFEEKEMKIFFGQFGEITRMRLSRSKKTGNSKGFAFIEFPCQEVAKIVAETMNNYRMFGKTIQAKVVPHDKLHPEVWKGSNRKFDTKAIKNRHAKTVANSNKYDLTHETRHAARVSREDKKLKKLSAMGIEYEFDGLVTQESKTKQVAKAKEARLTLERAADEEASKAKAAKKETNKKEKDAKVQAAKKDAKLKKAKKVTKKTKK